MKPKQPTSGYQIEYATNDPVVKGHLNRASWSKTAMWLGIAAISLFSTAAMLSESIASVMAVALIGTMTAFQMICYSDHLKSAWVRTLEVRIEKLCAANENALKPASTAEVPVA